MPPCDVVVTLKCCCIHDRIGRCFFMFYVCTLHAKFIKQVGKHFLQKKLNLFGNVSQGDIVDASWRKCSDSTHFFVRPRLPLSLIPHDIGFDLWSQRRWRRERERERKHTRQIKNQ